MGKGQFKYRSRKVSVFNRLTLLFLFSFLYAILYANDGAYYISGNQLIPIVDTDISVQKEVLSIKRKNKRQVEVSVYYEFYNPGKTKSITVGFEASSPEGDADGKPKNGKHPNMSDFHIEMNNNILAYEVAIVKDSLYYQNGEFKTINPKEVANATGENPNFYYVYYFSAKFKEGANIIRHTYVCDLSGSVDYTYQFDYILTAANRWKNNQIDDFTLIIDMGEFQDFYIDDTAFGKSPKWALNGKGFIEGGDEYKDYYADPVRETTRTNFCIRKGEVLYKATNFSPQEELKIKAYRPVAFMPHPFNYREKAYLSWMLVDDEEYRIETTDEMSKRILKNLPFARRGYIFSSPEINEFYSNQPWYTPDSSFKGNVSSLTQVEQEWVMRYSK